MTAAIYCRLSKEDDSKERESESIQNQKSLLIHYAIAHEWGIYQIYSDDDYRGCDRNRPAFHLMLEEAKQGKFQIILCKTQSRFTRDMEIVEKYLHGLFPLWGIRFIALADSADTAVKGNKKARQINGLINEWYLEDLSDNIRMVFSDKRARGQYLASYPLYGYRKDPADHNHLLVDAPAAKVVSCIFQMAIQGHGTQFIADSLNKEGIPNPTRYKRLCGTVYFNPASKPGREIWTAKAVQRMLHNQMYLGNMVQGRTKKVSYKSERIVSVPKEEWVIVPGTHEAIIDAGTFYQVQALMRTRTRVSGCGDVHLFAGKVKCMDCGTALSKQISSYKGKVTEYLRCRLFAQSRALNLCSRHSVRVDQLAAITLQKLREHTALFDTADFGALLEQSPPFEKRQASFQSRIKNLRLQSDRQTRVLQDLFYRKSDGLLEEPLFLQLSQSCIAEKKEFDRQIIALEIQLAALQNTQIDRAKELDQLKSCLHMEQLTRELVCAFIDFIEVGEHSPDTGEQKIRIHWNF